MCSLSRLRLASLVYMQIKWVYDGLYKVGMGLDEALCLRLGRVYIYDTIYVFK